MSFYLKSGWWKLNSTAGFVSQNCAKNNHFSFFQFYEELKDDNCLHLPKVGQKATEMCCLGTKWPNNIQFECVPHGDSNSLLCSLQTVPAESRNDAFFLINQKLVEEERVLKCQRDESRFRLIWANSSWFRLLLHREFAGSSKSSRFWLTIK